MAAGVLPGRPGAAVGNPTGRRQAPDIAGRTHPGRQRGKGDTAGRTSAPVEQVGRRWSGRRRGGREPEVGENPPDDDGVLDGGNHAHAAATPRTGQHVHRERVPHQLRPRPLARRRRWGRLHAHAGGRVSTRHRRRRQRFALVSAERHDGVALRRAARLRPTGGPRRARRDGWSGRATSQPPRRDRLSRGCPARRRPPGRATDCATPAHHGGGRG